MTFGADAKTQVQARGAGTKTRQTEAAGKPGPHLTDVLTVGETVAVTYRDNAGKPYASLIRTIPAASATSGSVKEAEMPSSGTVKAIGPGSLTIDGGAGSGASFTQTFLVNAETTVIGKGVGPRWPRRAEGAVHRPDQGGRQGQRVVSHGGRRASRLGRPPGDEGLRLALRPKPAQGAGHQTTGRPGGAGRAARGRWERYEEVRGSLSRSGRPRPARPAPSGIRR